MNNSTAVTIAYIASFAALIIALGAVSIPVGTAGVPIVLQNMGVLLAAMLLGWVRGGLCVALFLGVGLIGIPNLSGWNTTIAALSGHTVGYLVGYLISGFIVGALAQQATRVRNVPTRFAIFAFAGIVGVLIQYTCGIIGLMIRVDLSLTAAVTSNLIFIPGDAIKIIAAAAIATAVTRAIPDLLPSVGSHNQPHSPTRDNHTGQASPQISPHAKPHA